MQAERRCTTRLRIGASVESASKPHARVEMAERSATRRGVMRLLVAGALLHLLATASVYGVGRSGALPNILLSNGVLQGDGKGYLERCDALGRDMSRVFGKGEQVHVRTCATHMRRA
jgi:hypothetical protein